MANSGKTGSHGEGLAAAARVWRGAAGGLEGAKLQTCWRLRSANVGLSANFICPKSLRIRTWRGRKSTWAPSTKTPSLTWSRKSRSVGSVLAKHQWTHGYNSARCLEMNQKKNSLPHKKLTRLKLQPSLLQPQVHNHNKPQEMDKHLLWEILLQKQRMMFMLRNNTLEKRRKRNQSRKLINLVKLPNLKEKRSNCKIVLKS